MLPPSMRMEMTGFFTDTTFKMTRSPLSTVFSTFCSPDYHQPSQYPSSQGSNLLGYDHDPPLLLHLPCLLWCRTKRISVMSILLALHSNGVCERESLYPRIVPLVHYACAIFFHLSCFPFFNLLAFSFFILDFIFVTFWIFLGSCWILKMDQGEGSISDSRCAYLAGTRAQLIGRNLPRRACLEANRGERRERVNTWNLRP